MEATEFTGPQNFVETTALPLEDRRFLLRLTGEEVLALRAVLLDTQGLPSVEVAAIFNKIKDFKE